MFLSADKPKTSEILLTRPSKTGRTLSNPQTINIIFDFHE